jgi:preprotein translocase subunit SecE
VFASFSPATDAKDFIVALSIYKPGQGYWTRVLSAVGAALLVAAVVAWLWNELAVIGANRFLVQTVMAISVIGVAGLGLFLVMNKPRIVDFFIATDSEMRKVNWPSRREIIGSTWVVIIGTLFLAVLLWLIDIGFAFVFQYIGIIRTTAEAVTK